MFGEGRERLERVDMRLMAAAARRRVRQLTGRSEGAVIVEAAEAIVREQLVVSPARMTVALIGGSPSEH